MQHDALMYVDKIKDIVYRSKNFNVASLVHSKTNVIVPHGLKPKCNIIHIRPGAVILNNPYMDLYDFYYREDLNVNIIGTKKLTKDLITYGIVVDPKRIITNNQYNLVAGNPFPFYKENKLSKYIFGYKYYLRDLHHRRREDLKHDKGYKNNLQLFIENQKYNPDGICMFKPYGTDSVYQYKHVIHNELDTNIISDSWVRNELTSIEITEKIIGLDFIYKRYKKNRSEMIINGVTIRELDPIKREKLNMPEPFEGFNELLEFMYHINLIECFESKYTNTCFEGKIIGKNVLNNTYNLEYPYYFIVEHQYEGLLAEACDNWQEKPYVDEEIFKQTFTYPNKPIINIRDEDEKYDLLKNSFNREECYDGATGTERYYMNIMKNNTKERPEPLKSSNKIMYGFNINFFNLSGNYREEAKYDHILSSFWKHK